ncbi:MAG: 2-oxoacid:acceptor oxidoreductase family protein [Anaerolineales bacterium]|nr:MAG: 2-oxoacid:acceptor oxidoreductase family protein [Anaerolineales bacterium]
MAKLTEIRWHGRAGQGIVTAGELLAEGALKENMYFQAFPDYGPERMGAPIKSYTRISDEPIDVHYQILSPEVVVVVNPNVLSVVDVTEGLAEDGVVIVNSPDPPERIREALGLTGKKARVFTVDATGIALETLKRDIPATLMLGAIIRATGLVDLEKTVEVVQEKLGAKLRGEVVDANVTALRRAHEAVKEG